MMKPMNRARHLGITAVAIFAIIVGIGEMIVGFTGNFLGILSTPLMPPSLTIIIGLFYILGGLSFLTMRKWGAALGMIFVAAALLGRVHFVATGISPASGDDAIKIIISGVIAVTIIVYVSSQWDKFN
jgi:hypothetical protein